MKLTVETKFDLGDTVRVLPGNQWEGREGNVLDIKVHTRAKKEEDREPHIEYVIEVDDETHWSFFDFQIEKIEKRQFHKNRYHPQRGNIILKNGNRYLVIDTYTDWDATGARMGYSHVDGDSIPMITIRKLDSNGQPTGKSGDYRVEGEYEIVGKMKERWG